MILHDTQEVSETLDILDRINDNIKTLDKKAEDILNAMRVSREFLSDSAKQKMFHDIEIAKSAKIRLFHRFNNIKYKNL